VHELAVEEVVGGCVGVAGVEAPARFALWIGADDGDGEVGLEVVEVSD